MRSRCHRQTANTCHMRGLTQNVIRQLLFQVKGVLMRRELRAAYLDGQTHGSSIDFP